MEQKALTTKGNIHKLDYNKILNFCSSKHIIEWKYKHNN